MARIHCFITVLWLLTLSTACQDKGPQVDKALLQQNSAFSNYGKLQLPSGEKMHVFFAVDEKQQTKGLSGVRPKQFLNDFSMLFVNHEQRPLSFWMPDTYFNLDIFFLDKDLKILNVARDVEYHPGTDDPGSIPRTPTYFAQHVLEIASNSPFAKKIKVGDKLEVVEGKDFLTKTEK